jgi:hypothetical protein
MFIEMASEMSASSVGAQCMSLADMILLRSYGALIAW